MKKAPERLETERLILRKPELSDARAIFDSYSSDKDITRYLGWPRHRRVEDAAAFCAWAESEWDRWPAGPYLICDRYGLVGEAGTVLGSSGFGFESERSAGTGYVLAKAAWGLGLATETLRAMVEIAEQVGIVRLSALCYPGHEASYRVLEKCGFEREGVLRRHTELPNHRPGVLSDVLSYSRVFD